MDVPSSIADRHASTERAGASSKEGSGACESGRPRMALIIGSVALTVMLVLSFGYLDGLSDLADASASASADALDLLLITCWKVPPFACAFALIIPWFLVRTYRPMKRADAPIAACALILAACTVAGTSLARTSSVLTLGANPFHAVMSILSLIAIALFAFAVLRSAFGAVAAHRFCGHRGWSMPAPYVAIFCIMVLSWLPYIVAFAPGSVCYDAYVQLAQFGGHEPWSTHHPVFSTLLYGSVFSAGAAAGGANGGVLALVIMQTLCFAGALTYEVRVMERAGAPRWVLVCTVAFFCIVPIFGSYCQWVVKDALFACIFALYMCSVVLYAADPRRFCASKGSMAMLLISAAALGLIRNNAIYVVILSLPFLVLFHDGARARLRALVPLVLAIVASVCINQVCVAIVQAESGSIKEALSIPFQQTARFAREHPQDVQEWERAAIDQALGYDTLASRYVPTLSDEVKAPFDDDASLSDYLSAWASQGARDPLLYLDATAENTYLYWSLHAHAPFKNEFVWFTQPRNDEGFSWSYWMPNEVSAAMYTYIQVMRELPLVGFLSQAGLYAWLLLIEAAYLLSRGRGRYLIVLLPCLILLLTYIAGPSNGSMRYALPFATTAPVLLWFAIRACVEGKGAGASLEVVQDGLVSGVQEALAGDEVPDHHDERGDQLRDEVADAAQVGAEPHDEVVDPKPDDR